VRAGPAKPRFTTVSVMTTIDTAMVFPSSRPGGREKGKAKRHEASIKKQSPAGTAADKHAESKTGGIYLVVGAT